MSARLHFRLQVLQQLSELVAPDETPTPLLRVLRNGGTYKSSEGQRAAAVSAAVAAAALLRLPRSLSGGVSFRADAAGGLGRQTSGRVAETSSQRRLSLPALVRPSVQVVAAAPTAAVRRSSLPGPLAAAANVWGRWMKGPAAPAAVGPATTAPPVAPQGLGRRSFGDVTRNVNYLLPSLDAAAPTPAASGAGAQSVHDSGLAELLSLPSVPHAGAVVSGKQRRHSSIDMRAAETALLPTAGGVSRRESYHALPPPQDRGRRQSGIDLSSSASGSSFSGSFSRSSHRSGLYNPALLVLEAARQQVGQKGAPSPRSSTATLQQIAGGSPTTGGAAAPRR